MERVRNQRRLRGTNGEGQNPKDRARKKENVPEPKEIVRNEQRGL